MPRPKKRGFGINQKGRSTGERFIKLPHWMLKSEAWLYLGLTARCLLIEIWQRHNGQNNGEISYSVREAAKALRISKDTAMKYFRELEEKGFIEARQKGSFNQKIAMATEWELTMERYRDRPPSKPFMSWNTSSENRTRSE